MRRISGVLTIVVSFAVEDELGKRSTSDICPQSINNIPHPGIQDMSGHKRKDVAKRISRIHGHVHGIMEMVNEGRSYSEIVQQISAVKAALDSAINVIIEDLVEDCVQKAGKKDSQMSQTLLEIKQVVNRL